MEGRYPPAVYIALTDCKDRSKEKEFNTWYNRTLIPALEGLGYVKNSRRYENIYGDEPTFRARPKYLSVHEVHHDDFKKALKEIHAKEADLTAKGKGFPDMLTKVNTMYRRVGPEFRSGRPGSTQLVYCGLVGYSDPTRRAEFDKWYNDRHSPDALETLFDVGYRYDVVDINDPLPHLSSPCLSMYETNFDLATLQPRLEAFRKKMIEVDPIWVELLSIWYNGLFKPMK